MESSLDRGLVGPGLKSGTSAKAVGVNSEAACLASLSDSGKHASFRNRGTTSDGWVRASVVKVVDINVSDLLGCLVKELLALVGFVRPVAGLHDLVICGLRDQCMSLPLLDVVVVVDSSWVITAVSCSISDASISDLSDIVRK